MSSIKIPTNLINDPAVSAIAAKLSMAEVHVFGCLVTVWLWASIHTADGFIKHGTSAQIDRKTGKKGFAAAMEKVGWLRIEADGVVLPKWSKHIRNSTKARQCRVT